jgi:predicted peptidase
MRPFLFFLVSVVVFVACRKSNDFVARTPVAVDSVPPPPVVVPDSVSNPGQSFVIETEPAIHSPVTKRINSIIGGYYEGLPVRYDSSSNEYPLLVFLHGIGELGNGSTDLPKMVKTGIPRLLSKKQFPPSFNVNGEHFSFIVLSPQFQKRPDHADVNTFIEFALKEYRIDVSRIYITGLSMGGGVTWEYGAMCPGKVAAIVPMCGGSWPDPKLIGPMAANNLPVWAFHNADDKVVSVNATTGFVNGINALNPEVKARMTVWPNGGHDVWTKASDPATREGDKNIYEWMLGYKR